MARLATFGLGTLMLENEWPLLVGVAGEADAVPRGCGPQLLADKSTMWIVAIRALHEAFFHAMVKGHVELRLLV
jgi:hypothetical protein